MIEFKKIRWKNFLSTGNYFTEISLNKDSTNLILGTNRAKNDGTPLDHGYPEIQ